MKRSTQRILSTHVGSIIRPPKLTEAIRARLSGDAYGQLLKNAVTSVVKRQAEAGIDVVNDGEFGKSTSWSLYILKRLSGFEMRDVKAGANPFARGADRNLFKEFYEEMEGARASHTWSNVAWSNVTQQDAVCTGPIQYVGRGEMQRDIDNLKAGLTVYKEGLHEDDV